jgi:hypothetical protein
MPQKQIFHRSLPLPRPMLGRPFISLALRGESLPPLPLDMSEPELRPNLALPKLQQLGINWSRLEDPTKNRWKQWRFKRQTLGLDPERMV